MALKIISREMRRSAMRSSAWWVKLATTNKAYSDLFQQSRHPLYKASITDEIGKFSLQILLYMLRIVAFEIPILALVKVNHDCQLFAIA